MTRNPDPNTTDIKLPAGENLTLSIYLAAGYDDEEAVALCRPACRLTPEFVATYREARGPQLELLRRKLHQRSLTAGLAVALERLRRLNHLAFLIERRLETSEEERHFGPLVGHYLDLLRHVHDITKDQNPAEALEAEALAQVSAEFAESDPEYQSAFCALVRAADRVARDRGRDAPAAQPGPGTRPVVSTRVEGGEVQPAEAER